MARLFWFTCFRGEQQTRSVLPPYQHGVTSFRVFFNNFKDGLKGRFQRLFRHMFLISRLVLTACFKRPCVKVALHLFRVIF